MSFTTDTTEVCEQCIKQANFHLGCKLDNGDIEWSEIPNVLSIVESIADNDATERRHSHTNGLFRAPDCEDSSRTRTYAVTSEYCPGFHPRCFGNEGDIVCCRAFSSKDDAGVPEGEFCEFEAKLLYPAKNWDSNSTDVQQLEWSFEAIGKVVEGGITCDANSLRARVENGGAAVLIDDSTNFDGDPDNDNSLKTFTYQGLGDTPVTVSGTPDDLAATSGFTITAFDASTFFRFASTYDDGGTLPDGLTISATTGEVTGTPTMTGTFPVVITGSDATGNSDTISFDWVVN